MGSVSLNWNPQKLVQEPTERALKRAVDDLAEALSKQFTAVHWAWPAPTERHNGEVAGTLRDLVDSGALQRSQTRPERVSALHYRIRWTEPYAAAVFLGAVFKTRQGSLPARNIAYGAFQTFNLAEHFAHHWRRA